MLIHVLGQKDFVQINSDYSIENRVNNKTILFYKNMASGEFVTLGDEKVTEQKRFNNLYFAINWYLGKSRKEEHLRIIYALGFDVDTVKDKIPEDRMWKNIKDIELKYGLIPHIINKTMGGFHIFYLFEPTPYLNFSNDVEKLYITIRNELEADKKFNWRSGILKVVGSYDFRKYGNITNIKNENHNRYKLTDCRQILGDEIFNKYNLVNFEQEFKNIEEENKIFTENERITEIKKNFFVYRINEINFLVILEKLKDYGYDFRIDKENKVEYYIDNTLIDTFQISYFEEEGRAIDWKREKRELEGKTSRGSNYGFLYFAFGELENRIDKDTPIKEKEAIKEIIRKFVGKYFGIYSQLSPENYINTNKLIFEEFISSPLEFNEHHQDFLLQNEIINEEGYLTSTPLFLFLSILKKTEMEKNGTIDSQKIDDLLSHSHLKYNNINKQQDKYITILKGLSMLYRDIHIKGKDSDKVRVYLIGNLVIDDDLISFKVLKNYFKLQRDEKYYYRGIPIQFITDEKISISTIYFYVYLFTKFLEIKNPKINNKVKHNEENITDGKIVKIEGIKEISLNDWLFERGWNEEHTNKSKYKLDTIKEILYFKKLLPNNVRINITKDNFIQIIKIFEKKL